jgi:hypothetical protein
MSATQSVRINSFLEDAAQMVTREGGTDLGRNRTFSSDVQTLDGFRVGFMQPRLFTSLCTKYGLDPKESEAIMMQTTKRTDPHVHLHGQSTFLPLGTAHGFKRSRGGTFMGRYRPEEKKFSLQLLKARAGKPFRVPAGKIHFFAPLRSAKFTAIAFVSPRIKQRDGSFDMLHFTKPTIHAGATQASVSLVEHPPSP